MQPPDSRHFDGDNCGDPNHDATPRSPADEPRQQVGIHTVAGRRLRDRLAPAMSPERTQLQLDIEAIEAEAAPLPPAPPLDVDALISMLETIKRGSIRYPEDIGHDRGVAHAQDAIRAYARRLSASTEPERP